MITGLVRSVQNSGLRRSPTHLSSDLQQLGETRCCLIGPGLKMHCFRRTDANQDTQHFHTGSSLCQRWVESDATLFDGGKSGRVRDDLKKTWIFCVIVGPGDCCVLLRE